MAYSFRDRLLHTGTRMREINTIEVVYSRGSNRATLQASPGGRQVIDETNPQAEIIISEQHDYIFTASEFNWPRTGDPITPRNGDRIEEVATGVVAEVTSQFGDSCFRWTTRNHDRIRVHSKVIDDGKRDT